MYLQVQVRLSNCNVIVKYLAARKQGLQAETFSPAKSNPTDTENLLELTILTPTFYTTFVQYEDVA